MRERALHELKQCVDFQRQRRSKIKHRYHLESMTMFRLLAAALLGICSLASADDVLLTGHVQQVILQPFGTENCPEPCPVIATPLPNGGHRICITNAGGCQTLEVKVDHVYRGTSGPTRRFRSAIGEFGPSFRTPREQIVVSESDGQVYWSHVTRKDGKLFIDSKRLWSVNGVKVRREDDAELIELDEILARSER